MARTERYKGAKETATNSTKNTLPSMSEPVVTSNTDRHTAPISKKAHPHSVAHETVPPESRPVGEDHHVTTGPNDPPPGAPEGENYPPQLHAGKVGLGPHYAEVQGNDNGFGAKLTGLKEQLKGKMTHNPELVQKGHDRTTGELKAKQQAEDDAKSPFKNADDPKQEPAASDSKAPTENTGATAPPDAPRDVGVEARH